MLGYSAVTQKYENMPDMCQTCKGEAHLKIYYPKQVKRQIVKKGRVEAYYTCDHGHVWTCWWSVDHLDD